MSDPTRLDGRVGIVTGAGAGIGRSIALGMARAGASVVVNDMNATAAAEAVAAIEAEGGQATACVAAVGSAETADLLVDTALERFGGLDILVNNAGVVRDAMLWRMTDDDWDLVINVHLKGAFLNGRAAVSRVFRDAGRGKILNITSRAGLRGNVGQSNYAAAKMGIVGLTLTWALELKRYHVNVNAIAPVARTGMTLSMPDAAREQMFAALADNVLGRMGEPEDVAPVAVFLVSDAAAFITGQIIGVTGQAAALL